jgi:hypothetical protein
MAATAVLLVNSLGLGQLKASIMVRKCKLRTITALYELENFIPCSVALPYIGMDKKIGKCSEEIVHKFILN